MASSDVAQHYNSVQQVGIGGRTESRIFYQRNLSNWIKSQLIDEVLTLLRNKNVLKPRVLDLACGKGGDLKKWKIGGARSLVMADIADVSIEQAEGRYKEFSDRDAGRSEWFPVQFIVADCCKVDLSTLITDPTPFDVVSCQFALHYSFVDEQSARRFLANATQSLKPGGYFLGTLPDADRIVWAARENNGEFKNSVCSIRFENKEELDGQPPLFGSMFHFELDSQVNCPEFLAYFPLLQHLLEEMDMELVFVRRFPDAINHWKDCGRGLMGRMQGLEPYPPAEGVKLAGEDAEYSAAAEFIKTLDPTQRPHVGTLSKSEWEAVCMYLVFAFRKKGEVETNDAEGKVEPTGERNQTEQTEVTTKATEAKVEPTEDEEPPAKVCVTEKIEKTEDIKVETTNESAAE